MDQRTCRKAEIRTVKTGSTLVSSAVPDRSSHKFGLAYTGLFQRRSSRICVPVKCFYVTVGEHSLLFDAGWSKEVVSDPKKHLGLGLMFASEPVMKPEEAAVKQLEGKRIDAILMTHLDCDHVSGLKDFSGIPIYASAEEIVYSKKESIRYGKLTEGYDYHTFSFCMDADAPFGKSADVFGDGTVTAYLTPTHSAGSVIYKIADDNKFALIVGDNGYMEDSWQKGIVPGPLYSRDNMLGCLEWIRRKSEEKNCMGIYCAHDPIDR